MKKNLYQNIFKKKKKEPLKGLDESFSLTWEYM